MRNTTSEQAVVQKEIQRPKWWRQKEPMLKATDAKTEKHLPSPRFHTSFLGLYIQKLDPPAE